MSAPLAGTTVLDFSRVLAGPHCTRLLADLGARVVKIERPGEGDEMRRGHLQLEPGRDDQSTYFTRLNAGKLSVAIDLAHPEAQAVVHDLVRAADVVVENFAPGVMARLGFGHTALAQIKPALVYCSISGFGETGPLRTRSAFAHIINAMSGVMHLEQGADAVPRVGYLQAADVLAGTHAFGAILAGLLRRSRTGEGTYIDVSMLECLIAAEDISFGAVLNGGPAIQGPRPGMVIHPIGDRHVALQTVGAPQLWPRLLALIERQELAQDPRFATPMARRQNWPALRAIIERWLDRFASVDAAIEALSAARIPCAPVLTPAEVTEHPHLEARGFFHRVSHPARGTVRITGTPFRLDGRPVDPAGPAPYHTGEHTRHVLTELLGYTAERVETLLAQHVVQAP